MKLLNEILEIIDNASIENDIPFQSNNDKGIYESNLMFIYRRAEAAKYHLSNVHDIINEEKNKELPDLKDIKTKYSSSSIKASISISRHNGEVSHEFVAFLSAIRSGLDFMSKCMIRHIKGVQGDSLKTLLKLKDKKSNELLKLIKENEDWLVFLRGYRDALIHNFNQVYHVKSTKTREYGQSNNVFYPIVVSKEIPKFEPDTRKYRSLFNIENKFDSFEWTYEVSSSSGKTTETKREVKPSKGYVEIEKFMEEQYNNYNDLFNKFLETLKEIDLKIIELKTV